MRPQQQGRRQRSRGGNNNNRNRNQNPLSRSYESNGPDVKIRGNPQTIADKYAQLARDAISSGDNVMAENYYQHAEHYTRIILAAQPAQQPQEENDGNQQQANQQNGNQPQDGGQQNTAEQNADAQRNENKSNNNRSRNQDRNRNNRDENKAASPETNDGATTAAEPEVTAPAEPVAQDAPSAEKLTVKPRTRKPRAPKTPKPEVAEAAEVQPKNAVATEPTGEAAE